MRNKKAKRIFHKGVAIPYKDWNEPERSEYVKYE